MKSVLSYYIYMAKALLKFKKELNGKICLQFAIDEEPWLFRILGPDTY